MPVMPAMPSPWTGMKPKTPGFGLTDPSMNPYGGGGVDVSGNAMDPIISGDPFQPGNPAQASYVTPQPIQEVAQPGVISVDTSGLGDLAYGPSPGASSGDGRPQIPPYASILNPDGSLKYSANFAPSGYAGSIYDPVAGAQGRVNTQALEALRARGTSQGPSPWLNLMNKRIAGQEAGLVDSAAQDAASARSGAFNAAATHGGIGSGAAARLAGNQQANEALGTQGAHKWAADAGLQAGLADEQQKLGILENLPSQELGLGQFGANLDLANAGNTLKNNQFNAGNALQNSQFNASGGAANSQFNTGNAIADVHGQNPYNMGVYSEQMKGYSADQMAKAIAASGGDPGILQQILGAPQQVLAKLFPTTQG